MPGPPRKPTAIKAAEGNPGKRRLNEAELLLEPEEPERPDWLDAGAREIWDGLVPELMHLRVLQTVDQIQLANLCDACSILIAARAAMQALPAEAQMLVRTPNGSIQQNPLIGIINRQKFIIHRLACEFGLTPAARARLMSGDFVPSSPHEKTIEEMLESVPMSDRFSEPSRPN